MAVPRCFTLCRGSAVPVGSVVSFGVVPGTFSLPKQLDGGERVGAQLALPPYGTKARVALPLLRAVFGSSRRGSTPLGAAFGSSWHGSMLDFPPWRIV